MTKQANDRPITFPKVAEGAWRNAETGVQIHTVERAEGRFYLVTQPTRGVNPIRVATDSTSLKVARRVALNAVLRYHDTVATAYDEATRENVTRLALLTVNGEGMSEDFLADVRRHADYASQAWNRGDLTAANEWVRVTEQAIAERRAARV